MNSVSIIQTLPSEGYVRLPTILQVYPIGKSTWWAGVKTGRFPTPIKLSSRTTVWRVEDIRQLLEKPCPKPAQKHP